MRLVQRQVSQGHLRRRCKPLFSASVRTADIADLTRQLGKLAALQFGMEGLFVALLLVGDQRCSRCNRRAKLQLLAWRSGLDGLSRCTREHTPRRMFHWCDSGLCHSSGSFSGTRPASARHALGRFHKIGAQTSCLLWLLLSLLLHSGSRLGCKDLAKA